MRSWIISILIFFQDYIHISNHLLRIWILDKTKQKIGEVSHTISNYLSSISISEMNKKKRFAGIFSWSSNFLNTVYWICQSKNDQKCEQNSREWQSMKFEYLELVHHGDSSEILSHLYTKWYASMYSFSMTTRVEHIIAQQTECRIVSNKLIWTNTFRKCIHYKKHAWIFTLQEINSYCKIYLTCKNIKIVSWLSNSIIANVFIRIYEKAHLRSDFRKKILPWLKPTKALHWWRVKIQNARLL